MPKLKRVATISWLNTGLSRAANRARVAAHIEIELAAGLLGLRVSKLRRYEDGLEPIPTAHLAKMASVYRVTLQDRFEEASQRR